MTLNPAIKAIVVNCAFSGFFLNLPSRVPVILVGQPMAAMLQMDWSSPGVARDALVAPDLKSAMDLARRTAKTDHVIIFDGSFGAINFSRSLGEHLLSRASAVARRVDRELLPMWLRQRGIEPESL